MATDPNGTLTFVVRDAIDGMGLDEESVDHLSGTSLAEADGRGFPHRTAFFADMVIKMWDTDRAV